MRSRAARSSRALASGSPLSVIAYRALRLPTVHGQRPEGERRERPVRCSGNSTAFDWHPNSPSVTALVLTATLAWARSVAPYFRNRQRHWMVLSFEPSAPHVKCDLLSPVQDDEHRRVDNACRDAAIVSCLYRRVSVRHKLQPRDLLTNRA